MGPIHRLGLIKRESGQATPEYAAVVVLIVAMVTTLAAWAPGIAGAIKEAVTCALEEVGGGEGSGCSGSEGSDSAGVDDSTPDSVPPSGSEDPFTDPCSESGGVIASESEDDEDIELAPCPFPDDGGGGGIWDFIGDVAEGVVDGIVDTATGVFNTVVDAAHFIGQLSSDIANFIEDRFDEFTEALARANRWVEERLAGTPTPRSDTAAYALVLVLDDVELIACGSSSGGFAIYCVNGADEIVPDGADAFTLGHFVFCAVVCEPGSDLVAHELVHVEQFEEYGDAFLALYAKEAALHGTECGNRFEVPAYEENWPCPH
jgi:hypothetical protein